MATQQVFGLPQDHDVIELEQLAEKIHSQLPTCRIQLNKQLQEELKGVREKIRDRFGGETKGDLTIFAETGHFFNDVEDFKKHLMIKQGIFITEENSTAVREREKVICEKQGIKVEG